jgi:hypothetical protein
MLMNVAGARVCLPPKAVPNHSPNFFLDERALVTGVRALAMVTANYLAAAKTD